MSLSWQLQILPMHKKRRDPEVPHERLSLTSQRVGLDSASELPSTFQPHILLAWGEWPTVWVKCLNRWPAKTKKKKEKKKKETRLRKSAQEK